MALELVNPTSKGYLAFAGAIKHLWAKAKAMQWAWASGEGIQLWQSSALTPQEKLARSHRYLLRLILM